MKEVITIGVDLAKNVFQVHGVDGSGAVVVRRQLRRGQVLPFFKKQPPCLIGMEACATSHHWAREIEALGHQVRLMPPRYVKPYVKRNKNDMADAEAICEAVTRPTMRFVEIKTADQQSVLMLHRTCHLFVRQRTMLINALRAHLAEFGIVAGVGRNGLERLLKVIEDGEDDRVPPSARDCLVALRAQLERVKDQILDADRRILAWHRMSEVSQRLDDIPGVGPLSVMRRAKQTGYTRRPWLSNLLQRRSTKIAAIAPANKNARTARAMMAHGTFYQEPVSQAA